MDLTVLRKRKIDLAALKRVRLDPQELRRRATKLRQQLTIRSAVAITIGLAETTVRLVRREGDETRPGNPHRIPLGADTLVSKPDAWGQELAALLSAENIRERRCVVCMPPSWAFTHSTDIPELPDEDLRGYLELRAEKEFPLPLSELQLAHSSFLLPDGRRRVTLAAVPNKRIAAVEQALAKAGCKLASLSLGLDYLLHVGEGRSQVHLLAGGGLQVDIVITAGGGIAGVRSIAASAAPGDAEFDAAAFCREVRIMLGRLPDGIRQGVNEAHFGGSSATAFALCEKTRETMQKMGLFSPACTPPPAEETASGEAAAAALAAGERFLRDRPAPFEFITPEVKPWQEWLQKVDSKRRRILVAIAAAIVVLPILALIFRSHTESSLQQEWAGMRVNVGELEKLQQKIRKFHPWFDSAPQTLIAIDALVSCFPEGGDAWAKSIQIHEAGKVTCTGFAKNQAALSDLLTRLRAKSGVNELQLVQSRGVAPSIQYTITYQWGDKNAS